MCVIVSIIIVIIIIISSSSSYQNECQYHYMLMHGLDQLKDGSSLQAPDLFCWDAKLYMNSSVARSLLLLALLDEVGEVALAAVVAVEVHRHEDAGPADLVRALAAQARDLVVAVHLVELQDCKLHLRSSLLRAKLTLRKQERVASTALCE